MNSEPKPSPTIAMLIFCFAMGRGSWTEGVRILEEPAPECNGQRARSLAQSVRALLVSGSQQRDRLGDPLGADIGATLRGVDPLQVGVPVELRERVTRGRTQCVKSPCAPPLS